MCPAHGILLRGGGAIWGGIPLPLLDMDLVETTLAFPPWVKQHHGIKRYLFRQAI